MMSDQKRTPLTAEYVKARHAAAMKALADVERRRKWGDSKSGSPVAVLALWEEIARLHIDPPVLWCCHVRGPDDVHAAPDYETARAWSDRFNDLFATLPRGGNWPDGRAAPALWPHAPQGHADALPKCLEQFADGRLP